MACSNIYFRKIAPKKVWRTEKTGEIDNLTDYDTVSGKKTNEALN